MWSTKSMTGYFGTMQSLFGQLGSRLVADFVKVRNRGKVQGTSCQNEGVLSEFYVTDRKSVY